jgi:hypothetical protein
VDLAELDQEMARLDAVYRTVATTSVDLTPLAAITDLGAAVEADLARLDVQGEAQALLSALVEMYAAGDESVRPAIRRSFDRSPSFRWAAHLSRDLHTVEDFRARLVYLSARDQSDDPRTRS